MRLGMIVALFFVMSTSVSAQTYPDVYRQATSSAFRELERSLPQRTFRVSTSEKKNVDGMVKAVSVNIKFDKTLTYDQLDALLIAKVPTLMKDLAAKIAPFKAVGSLPNTKQSTEDFTKQTPDSIVVYSVTGLRMRTRYLDGKIIFEALVGN